MQYTNYVDPLREEFFNADDLTLAARSGNLDGVIRMLFHPFNPLDVDELNTDGVTATYCTLLMIMKNEILGKQLLLIEIVIEIMIAVASRTSSISKRNRDGEERKKYQLIDMIYCLYVHVHHYMSAGLSSGLFLSFLYFLSAFIV